MTEPIPLPEPGGQRVLAERERVLSPAAVLAALAAAAGTALLGVAAGLLWAAVAPRAALVMTAPGEASLIAVETSAYIAADAVFVGIALAGGVISGLLGHLLAVRRHGAVAMAGVLGGAVAAAYLSRWTGEHLGLASFQHQLATLPAGARLHDALTLGAGSALAFWPLAAGLTAGGLELLAQREPARVGQHRAGPSEVGSLPDRPSAPARPAPGGQPQARPPRRGGETAVHDVDAAAGGDPASID